jgi:hypothetical protein
MSLHKTQQTQPMSMSNSLVCADRSEPRDLRSDRKHLKNKLKAIILQKYHNAINNQTFVGAKSKYKSTLHYPFEFCSDISPVIVLSTNGHLSLVIILLLPGLTFLVHATLIIDKKNCICLS